MRIAVVTSMFNRLVEDADQLLEKYRKDDGLRYLEYVPITPSDRLVPEDLAVTLLINSQVGSSAFKSLQDRGASISLASIPDKPLEVTSPQERDQLAELIGEVAKWEGFKASVATKVLHKKRPGLIPILDNQAIFGAYMNRKWPSVPASTDSISQRERIRQAIEWIFNDLIRPENRASWPQLQRIEPRRSLIELFDMVWWMHFRKIQPVQRRRVGGPFSGPSSAAGQDAESRSATGSTNGAEM